MNIDILVNQFDGYWYVSAWIADREIDDSQKYDDRTEAVEAAESWADLMLATERAVEVTIIVEGNEYKHQLDSDPRGGIRP